MTATSDLRPPVSPTAGPGGPGGAAGPGGSAGPSGSAGAAVLAGATGMAFVGGSTAVSGTLAGAPLGTAQAVRYALACLLLLGMARLWLLGVTGTGLVLFNVALVEGARHAEPALLGVAVACVPLVLVVLGPLLEGGRPGRRALLAAAVVTAGAALVQGTGRGDAAGLGWAAVVLGCEAGFTLLAVPVLGRHGPWGVSVHTTWLAALVFGASGLLRDGPAGVARLDAGDLLAVAYLAVGVTAVAFVLWYFAVRRLGAGRAGLLTGVVPVAAAATGIALGLPAPRPAVWLGVAVVAAGLALGLPARRSSPARPRPRPRGPSPEGRGVLAIRAATPRGPGGSGRRRGPARRRPAGRPAATG